MHFPLNGEPRALHPSAFCPPKAVQDSAREVELFKEGLWKLDGRLGWGTTSVAPERFWISAALAAELPLLAQSPGHPLSL